MATPHRTPFELTGADGGPLRGDVRRQPRHAGPAVIICHGFKGFKDWGFFPVLADRLARAGFTAVSFNFSGSGVGPEGDLFSEPERFGHGTFSGDLTDMATVWKAIAAGDLGPPPSRGGISVFGHSRGGGMAVPFATEHPVDALVTWNPIGKVNRWGPHMLRTWRAAGELGIENVRTGEILPLYTDILDDVERHRDRLDIAAAARRVTAPWLNVIGTGDIVVPPGEGQWEGGVEGQRAWRKTLRIEGAGHTFGAKHPWAGSTPDLDTAMNATVAFLVDSLLGGE